MANKLLQNLGRMIAGKPKEDLPDDVTQDRFLRSLRRQRRIQMEEMEKVKLKNQIADFERNRTKVHLFGIKDRPKQKEIPFKRKVVKKTNSSFFNKGSI